MIDTSGLSNRPVEAAVTMCSWHVTAGDVSLWTRNHRQSDSN